MMERFPEFTLKGFSEDLPQIIEFIPPDRRNACFDLGKQRPRATPESPVSQAGGKVLLSQADENTVFPDTDAQELFPPVFPVHRRGLRLLDISSKLFPSPPASFCGRSFLIKGLGVSGGPGSPRPTVGGNPPIRGGLCGFGRGR